MVPLPPTSTLFPYTTLFRSIIASLDQIKSLGSNEAAILVHIDGVKTVAQIADELGSDLRDRKSTRLNSSHRCISYAVFCLKKKIQKHVAVAYTGAADPPDQR